MGEHRDKAARVDGCATKSAATRARRAQQCSKKNGIKTKKPKRPWRGTRETCRAVKVVA